MIQLFRDYCKGDILRHDFLIHSCPPFSASYVFVFVFESNFQQFPCTRLQVTVLLFSRESCNNDKVYLFLQLLGYRGLWAFLLWFFRWIHFPSIFNYRLFNSIGIFILIGQKHSQNYMAKPTYTSIKRQESWIEHLTILLSGISILSKLIHRIIATANCFLC